MKRSRYKYDDKYTDAEFDELVGPVKQVMETAYLAHQKAGIIFQGKLEVGGYSSDQNFIKTYNERGRMLVNEFYEGKRRMTQTFNLQGKPVTTTTYNKEGVMETTATNTYDPTGLLIEEQVSYGAKNEKRGYSKWIYNAEGKIAEFRSYLGVNDEFNQKHTMEYDERGNYTIQKIFDKEGNLQYIDEKKYNDLNQHIESRKEWFKEESKGSNERVEYRYNNHNDCVESIHYSLDGTYLHSYNYDYEYDAEGNKILEDSDPFRLRSGETETVERDKRGNWTKKTTFYNRVPTNIFLRELVYFDDKKPKKLVHPLTLATTEEIAEPVYESEYDALEEDDMKWVTEWPNPSGAENFPHIRYYKVRYNEYPSLRTYNGPYIEAIALKKTLEENMEVQTIHTYAMQSDNDREMLQRYTLHFPDRGYLLFAIGISANIADNFDLGNFAMADPFYTTYVYLSNFYLFLPSEASGKRDEDFEEELNEAIQLCTLHQKPDKPTIQTVEVNGAGFVMREHAVQDNFEIRDLEVNYGYGFRKFHDDLMARLNNTTKGLVLFHGQPGTGKTYYIRHLLKSLAVGKKIVIYMPPNLVDHLADPGFMTFLSDNVKSWSEDGNTCVLLIEDAEPLLAKRQEGVRIQGVTNLLNLTDGLLNDMLKLQIICTFNVDLKKLDSALLRPGRLIARKEFTALSELDANLLASRLGIKHHFKKPATLGEIYAMGKDANTLIHEVDSDRDASTIADDF